MKIIKLKCATCWGSGRINVSKAEEDICPACDGKGYFTYPSFSAEEAIIIAQHFGFNITGDDAYD